MTDQVAWTARQLRGKKRRGYRLHAETWIRKRGFSRNVEDVRPILLIMMEANMDYVEDPVHPDIVED